jgi:hypothetical protein
VLVPSCKLAFVNFTCLRPGCFYSSTSVIIGRLLFRAVLTFYNIPCLTNTFSIYVLQYYEGAAAMSFPGYSFLKSPVFVG